MSWVLLNRAFRVLFLGSIATLALILSLPISPNAQQAPDPTVLACGDATHPPDLIPEVRAGAAMAAVFALSSQYAGLTSVPFILNRIKRGESVERIVAEIQQAINTVEKIAQGPNKECRSIASYLLPSLYVSKIEFQAAININSALPIPHENTDAFLKELVHVIHSVFESATSESTLESFSGRLSSFNLINLFAFIASSSGPLLDDRIFFQFLIPFKDKSAWEHVLCGGTETFSVLGYDFKFDGSFSLVNNDEQGNPYLVWAADGWLFSFLISLDEEGPLPDFLDIALHGCSTEFRTVAALLYIEVNIERFGESNENGLQTLAIEGGSHELRFQAAVLLAKDYAKDRTLSDIDLQGLALNGVTTEKRYAAGQALGLRWVDQVYEGKLKLSTNLTFLGADGKTLVHGTLYQFAAIHTKYHSELAQAVIAPLGVLYQFRQSL
ncbi:hypothetical protein HYR53_11015 [Candidatus Acetothermia bacterium]|nr:hypothetical protein [Candidatus Acetothermia bacterium]